MLPIEGVARPDDDPLRPDAEPDPLRPDADALALDTGVAPPEADAVFDSDEPPRSEEGGLREDVGFIGWLGTRRLTESYLGCAPLGGPVPRKARYRSAPPSIQAAINLS